MTYVIAFHRNFITRALQELEKRALDLQNVNDPKVSKQNIDTLKQLVITPFHLPRHYVFTYRHFWGEIM